MPSERRTTIWWWALAIFLASMGATSLAPGLPAAIRGESDSGFFVFFGVAFVLSALAIYREKLR